MGPSICIIPITSEGRRLKSKIWPSPWLYELLQLFCTLGFCGGQSGAGAGFLRVLRFPLPIFIPPIAPKIIIYHRGLYNRPKRPQYQGLRYLGTQSHPTNNNKKNNILYLTEIYVPARVNITALCPGLKADTTVQNVCIMRVFLLHVVTSIDVLHIQQ
jgi:hypothetical protein